eukprot:CAMPEP_0203912302 /NCGR_PEP_ID=MMETSP0359-20131031/53391_1 /ASSEMBLY_ACC=CAM_ASM_000338 /TAXON_ID=268821 /ORGANISM="Scrippsiella Hangoei, Strain SHTV-5" /LENGTH=368 /DNA_ID=CAMNT_0050838215 /DNA_START=65 /DNA_END=1168 /DNA_ORIENTATION=+
MTVVLQPFSSSASCGAGGSLSVPRVPASTPPARTARRRFESSGARVAAATATMAATGTTPLVPAAVAARTVAPTEPLMLASSSPRRAGPSVPASPERMQGMPPTSGALGSKFRLGTAASPLAIGRSATAFTASVSSPSRDPPVRVGIARCTLAEEAVAKFKQDAAAVLDAYFAATSKVSTRAPPAVFTRGVRECGLLETPRFAKHGFGTGFDPSEFDVERSFKGAGDRLGQDCIADHRSGGAVDSAKLAPPAIDRVPVGTVNAPLAAATAGRGVARVRSDDPVDEVTRHLLQARDRIEAVEQEFAEIMGELAAYGEQLPPPAAGRPTPAPREPLATPPPRGRPPPAAAAPGSGPATIALGRTPASQPE